MTRLLRYARGLLRECAHCAVEKYGQWDGSFTGHPAHRCCVEAGEGGRDQSIWPGILRLVRTGPESPCDLRDHRFLPSQLLLVVPGAQ